MVLFSSLCKTDGILLNDLCFASSPCSCSPEEVLCDYKSLYQFPAFTRINQHLFSLTIKLRGNHVRTIPSYGFSNLAWTNASSFYIFISDNQIDLVETHAFDGISSSVKTLDLANNSLTHIPYEITKLTALESLYILGNPIAVFDAGVMTMLGNTLTNTFSLSFGNFASFPGAIHYFKRLKSIIMSDMHFSTIYPHAFDHLSSSLKYLVFHQSSFHTFPIALCALTNLTLLRFEESYNLYKNASDDLDTCFGNMTKLEALYLYYNNLTVFPSTIKHFPSLHSIYLSDNSIQTIQTKDVRENNSIVELRLSNNSFSNIPEAINLFTELEYLDMSVNLISSIDDSDLCALHKLQTLKLDNNPISHISQNAFLHNTDLVNIYLDHTHLNRIPETVLGLGYLRRLTMSGNTVTCSCSAMSYLNQWSRAFNNHVTFSIYTTAVCSNGEAIRRYLRESLPKCK